MSLMMILLYIYLISAGIVLTHAVHYIWAEEGTWGELFALLTFAVLPVINLITAFFLSLDFIMRFWDKILSAKFWRKSVFKKNANR